MMKREDDIDNDEGDVLVNVDDDVEENYELKVKVKESISPPLEDFGK